MTDTPHPPPPAPSAEAPLPTHATHWVRDLCGVLLTTLLYFTAATRLEVFEKVTRAARLYESWQIDEMPMTLLVLTLGMAWFGWRRTREARSQLNERIKAQERVTSLLAHNRDLAQRLIVIQEEERRTLARELHDEVGQHCTAMRADASYIQHGPVAPDIVVSAQRIADSAEALYGLVKSMLARLRPPALDSLGIESALQGLCETWEMQTGIACALLPHAVCAPLPDTTAVALYRLVQESLSNVARHAHATHVYIGMGPSARPGHLSIDIKDNGIGLRESDSPRHGFGLISMRERVAALGGDIQFSSTSGHGLHIHIELPMGDMPP